MSSDETLRLIDRTDAYVGAQLRLCAAFGLRVKEAIMLDPWRCVVAAEDVPGLSGRAADEYLAIVRGAKGGRRRYVPIETDEQRLALAHARSVAGEGASHMGRPGFRLHQNYRRFYYVVQRCGVTRDALGVTAHGLRHEYAHRLYKRETGVPPPVVQRQPKAASGADHDARLLVSQRLGHSRKHIAGAYLGGVLTARRTGQDSHHAAA